MEQVLIGNMLPGGIPFEDENVNPTYKAHVQTDEGVKVAFVKQLDMRALYVECVCAVIGRTLNLPIPAPIIVRITNAAMPTIPANSSILAFGSEDAQHPSFRRFINRDSEEAMAQLKGFAKTLDVGVFDEWIANWDRNIGNILYDGKDEFYFIDHENAIPEGLNHTEPAAGNEILRCLYSNLSEFEKHSASKKVAVQLMPNYEVIPFPLIAEKTFATAYLDETEILSIITFLSDRITAVNDLFDKRVDIKQVRLAI
ncbi:MAG: hypothetical protein ACI8WB_003625 [Phenylobacterium sp.]|jgi:hypothetical protein